MALVIYRYCPHPKLVRALALGWRYAADLGPAHGEWSCLVAHDCPLARWPA